MHFLGVGYKKFISQFDGYKVHTCKMMLILTLIVEEKVSLDLGTTLPESNTLPRGLL